MNRVRSPSRKLGLHELTPGVGPDEPVDVQVPFRLERAHGGVGEGTERAPGLAGSQFVAELDQPLLDVEDLGALVAPAVDAHPVSVRPRPVDRQRAGGSARRDAS